MAIFLELKVTREVLGPTVRGVKTTRVFKAPLIQDEAYELEWLELKTDVEIAKVNEIKDSAVIIFDSEKIEIGEGKQNYWSKKIKDRFFFCVHFRIVEEDYSDEKMEGYELLINERYFVRDSYSQNSYEKDYSVDVTIDNYLDLEKIKKDLRIVGIDLTHMKVLVRINEEDIEVTLDKPGEYSHNEQCGYNDSFEITSTNVKIILHKKD